MICYEIREFRDIEFCITISKEKKHKRVNKWSLVTSSFWLIHKENFAEKATFVVLVLMSYRKEINEKKKILSLPHGRYFNLNTRCVNITRTSMHQTNLFWTSCGIYGDQGLRFVDVCRSINSIWGFITMI